MAVAPTATSLTPTPLPPPSPLLPLLSVAKYPPTPTPLPQLLAPISFHLRPFRGGVNEEVWNGWRAVRTTAALSAHLFDTRELRKSCEFRCRDRGLSVGTAAVTSAGLGRWQWLQDTSRLRSCCESRGGRPGLAVLTSLMVSVDVKQYWTKLTYWSQPVPNYMSTHIREHWATPGGMQDTSELRSCVKVEVAVLGSCP